MSIIIDNGNPSISNNAGDFSIENTNGNLNVITTDANPVNIRPNDTTVAEFDNTGITFNTELLVDSPAITIRDTNSSGNVHLWFEDETNTSRGILYWDRTASAMLLQVYNSSGVAQNNIQVREGHTRSTKPYYAPNGSVSAPGYAFTNDTDTGMYRPTTANRVSFTGGGTVLANLIFGQAQFNGHVVATSHNTYDLGISGTRWNDAFVVNGVTTGSDINLKMDVNDTPLGLNFIDALRPVEYKWKECNDIVTSGSPETIEVQPRSGVRKHHGLIAQEVKTVMDNQSISTNDFAGYIASQGSPVEYSLRYQEFIAPMIKAIQELKAENDDLKSRIEHLELLHGSPMV